MGNENLLPKNIRQIGEIQGRQKIYLEDYVMTYIRKMENRGKNDFLGILLGERKCTEDAEYVFVRGIMEVPGELYGENKEKLKQNRQEESGPKRDVEKESVGEKRPGKEKTGLWQAFQKRYGTQEEWTSDEAILEAGEEQYKQEKEGVQKKQNNSHEQQDRKINAPDTPKDRWEKFRMEQETHFPESQIVGCCAIGTWETVRMEELTQHIPEAKQMLYHLQDQEERLYWLEGERYEGVTGYFVFYEQNRQMQEYLSELFGESSVEKESAPDQAIISFREKVKSKADEKSRSFLKLASSFFVVGALLVGVIAVNRVSDLRQAVNVTGTSTASLEEDQGTLSDSEDTFSNVNVSVSADAESETTASTGATDILAGSDAFWADDEAAGTVTSDTADNAGETRDAESASGTNVVSDAESAIDTSTVSGTDTASDVGAVSETDTASDVSTVSETDTASDVSTVSETDTASDTSADSDTSETADTEAAVAAASRQVQASYVIRTGDTLAEICAKYYGSLDRLEELCEANGIEDANLIIPGQKIVLP